MDPNKPGSVKKWAKSISNYLFKKDKAGGAEQYFNPEDVTEQKREWLDSQTFEGRVTRWPEHIFEHLFIVGLPPNVEVTQIAEQLCVKERKRRTQEDMSTEPASAPEPEHNQSPQPAYPAKIIYQFPEEKPAPLSELEICALCFPHQVAPEKLRRTPSYSSLQEIIFGKQQVKSDQCFVFLLKVAGNLPMFGMVSYAKELIHRAPYLARNTFANCKAPFRQCLISAPRAYCMLSHYPFFELHFHVLNMVISFERLERSLEYEAEAAGSLGEQQQEQQEQQEQDERQDTQQEQHGCSSSKRYCAECEDIMTDMLALAHGHSLPGPKERAAVAAVSNSRSGLPPLPAGMSAAPGAPGTPSSQGTEDGGGGMFALPGAPFCEVCGRSIHGLPKELLAAIAPTTSLDEEALAATNAAAAAGPQTPSSATALAAAAAAAAAAGEADAADFDAARASFDGASELSSTERTTWRSMIDALSAAGSKLVEGVPAQGEVLDPDGVPVSIVQRMWELWTPPSGVTPSGGSASASIPSGPPKHRRQTSYLAWLSQAGKRNSTAGQPEVSSSDGSSGNLASLAMGLATLNPLVVAQTGSPRSSQQGLGSAVAAAAAVARSEGTSGAPGSPSGRVSSPRGLSRLSMGSMQHVDADGDGQGAGQHAAAAAAAAEAAGPAAAQASQAEAGIAAELAALEASAQTAHAAQSLPVARSLASSQAASPTASPRSTQSHLEQAAAQAAQAAQSLPVARSLGGNQAASPTASPTASPRSTQSQKQLASKLPSLSHLGTSASASASGTAKRAVASSSSIPSNPSSPTVAETASAGSSPRSRSRRDVVAAAGTSSPAARSPPASPKPQPPAAVRVKSATGAVGGPTSRTSPRPADAATSSPAARKQAAGSTSASSSPRSALTAGAAAAAAAGDDKLTWASSYPLSRSRAGSRTESPRGQPVSPGAARTAAEGTVAAAAASLVRQAAEFPSSRALSVSPPTSSASGKSRPSSMPSSPTRPAAAGSSPSSPAAGPRAAPAAQASASRLSAAAAAGLPARLAAAAGSSAPGSPSAVHPAAAAAAAARSPTAAAAAAGPSSPARAAAPAPAPAIPLQLRQHEGGGQARLSSTNSGTSSVVIHQGDVDDLTDVTSTISITGRLTTGEVDGYVDQDYQNPLYDEVRAAAEGSGRRLPSLQAGPSTTDSLVLQPGTMSHGGATPTLALRPTRPSSQGFGAGIGSRESRHTRAGSDISFMTLDSFHDEEEERQQGLRRTESSEVQQQQQEEVEAGPPLQEGGQTPQSRPGKRGGSRDSGSTGPVPIAEGTTSGPPGPDGSDPLQESVQQALATIWTGALPAASSLQLLHQELARQHSEGQSMSIRITSTNIPESPIAADTPRSRAGSRLFVSGTAVGTPVHRSHSSEDAGGLSLRNSVAQMLSSPRSSLTELQARSSVDPGSRSISQLVQSNSTLVLEQYYNSHVVPPNGVYTISFGDLYQVEYHRVPAGRAYAEVAVLRDILAYAEAELAQSIELWSVAALCRSLSLDNILAVLSAALLEKQMVMFCPNIGMLSACVLSLMPLLRPFNWQCLLLPVTPTGMLGFLEAPVPFVLGVQYKTHEVASKCSGLMRVNVYKDVVKNCPVPQMPGSKKLAAALAPHYARLRAAADVAAYRPVYAIDPEEAAAAGAFLELLQESLVAMCGDLRLYTITNVGMEKRTGFLFKDGYLDSFPAKDRAFMKAFSETQMFSVWSDQVISAFCETL